MKKDLRYPPLHVSSDLDSLRFVLESGRFVPLDNVPILPGGYLTGRFTFRCTRQRRGGAHVLPDIALAWSMSGIEDGLRATRMGGTEGAHRPSRVIVTSFDRESGAGTVAFRVSMSVSLNAGPIPFLGRNEVVL